MTDIERKAKAYDELFAKAKTMMVENTNEVDGAKILTKLFPQLAESEDERIRKGLIELVDGIYKGSSTVSAKEERDKYVAWLEKQGEHANFRNKIQVGDKVTRNKDGMLVNLSQLKRVAKKDEKQGEQSKEATYTHEVVTGNGNIKALVTEKVQLPNFMIGDTIVEKDLDECGYGTIKDIKDGQYIFTDGSAMSINEQGGWQLVKASANIEQKPADKIEPKFHEGDKIYCKLDDRTFVIKEVDLENGVYRYTENGCGNDIDYADELFELVEQKPTWSEEDEKKRTLLISILKVNHPNGYFKVNPANTLNMEAMHTEELVNWLKSLRPQKHWKPSEEQMEALDSAIHCYAGISPTNNREVYALEIMKEQLKKLRE